MVRKMIDRLFIGETSISYGNKNISVKNSVVLTNEEKTRLENDIANELYNIFTKNTEKK